jgi:DnaJ-class molecular chaperone
MNPLPADLYSVLGVARDATQEDISHAYRALLRRHHPDTRGEEPPVGSDAVLRDVVAAYRVLRDPDRRAAYDRQTATTPTAVHRTAAAQDRPKATRRASVRAEELSRPVAVRNSPDPQPPIVAGPVYWRSPPR